MKKYIISQTILSVLLFMELGSLSPNSRLLQMREQLSCEVGVKAESSSDVSAEKKVVVEEVNRQHAKDKEELKEEFKRQLAKDKEELKEEFKRQLAKDKEELKEEFKRQRAKDKEELKEEVERQRAKDKEEVERQVAETKDSLLRQKVRLQKIKRRQKKKWKN